jgi:hypothetical protein
MERKIMACEARQHIPLAKAYLCQDCDSIGNSAMRCPACASEVLMGLASVFDRKEKEDEDAGVSNLFQFPTLAA